MSNNFEYDNELDEIPVDESDEVLEVMSRVDRLPSTVTPRYSCVSAWREAWRESWQKKTGDPRGIQFVLSAAASGRIIDALHLNFR